MTFTKENHPANLKKKKQAEIDKKKKHKELVKNAPKLRFISDSIRDIGIGKQGNLADAIFAHAKAMNKLTDILVEMYTPATEIAAPTDDGEEIPEDDSKGSPADAV